MRPLITILTPTYNRVSLLKRVYKSLENQSNKNFEWLIVDDGSSDDTKDIIKTFKANGFSIRYYFKTNGGKHTALNFGVEKAYGDYILMLDSDDLLPENAIQIIIDKINKLPNYLGGIVGRKVDMDGNILGSSYICKELISNSLDIRYKYKVQGDLTEIFKKEVFHKFPFPIFEGEKFCPEALVWNRIAQEYDLLFFGESVYIAEYQKGGLTEKIDQVRMKSPKASMTHYSELAKYKIPSKEKIKANINFWRFSFNDKDWCFSKKSKMVNPLISIIGFPIGFLMFLNDKNKIS